MTVTFEPDPDVATEPDEAIESIDPDTLREVPDGESDVVDEPVGDEAQE